MQVQVNCGDGLTSKETLESWATDFLNESLGRFADEITRVEVQLSDDAHGKHGSQDVRCMLEARVTSHQPLAVNHFAQDMDEAIRGATKKLIKSLEHTLGKLDRNEHRARETIRKDPEAIDQISGGEPS
jgi:ribosome-associated translation inhibitor RaiA